MAIKPQILIHLVTVKRPTGKVSSSIGERGGGTLPTIASDVPARITKNDSYDNKGSMAASGFLQSSTHLMFTAIGLDIQEKDFVFESSDKYIVNYVDKKPGGAIDSHYQTYMTYNNTMQD